MVNHVLGKTENCVTITVYDNNSKERNYKLKAIVKSVTREVNRHVAVAKD